MGQSEDERFFRRNIIEFPDYQEAEKAKINRTEKTGTLDF
jgi:hypothetical protein